jgi:hypothetical protein
LDADFAVALSERKIFRAVRAGIVYDRSVLKPQEIISAENLYSPINVQLIPSDMLTPLLGSANDFDILGILGQPALDSSKNLLSEFNCLKIGFYSKREIFPRGALRYLTAAVSCLGPNSLVELLNTTVFHFYESLTLPSLLNIDLADVESIAHGIGLSFNISADSSEDVISRLPLECYLARSALLHFTCEKNVTLDEVYKVSKTISTRKNLGPFVSEAQGDQIKMYKRIRLKMGLRVSPGGRDGSRISLTAILFGIKSPTSLLSM